MKLMIRGAQNRHVGETKMNLASSRSHSVFTTHVECLTTLENGISKKRYGTLHIVDLAGSERVKISGATGAALTEASEINVSLTTLGRVISKVCSCICVRKSHIVWAAMHSGCLCKPARCVTLKRLQS